MSDAARYHRQSIRLKDYDYSQSGAYYMTVVTQGREGIFGSIAGGEMRLNNYGDIVARTWAWLSERYPYVKSDAYVVMPNHLHGIFTIVHPEHGDGLRTDCYSGPRAECRGGSRTAPTGKHKPLGRLIGAFKTVSTKHINVLRNTPGALVWQRNYYEHIIRDEESLNRIRRYIVDNPARWAEDTENPEYTKGNI